MKVELVSIDDLISDPSNARKHDKKNLEAIKGSLAKFGQQKPIVVGKNNIVIAGNGTLEAAKALKWKEIKVVFTDLEGTDATAYAIADNRTGELAGWDDKALSETLKSLQNIKFDLDAIGFDAKDLSSFIKADPKAGNIPDDEIPEVEENKHGVLRGQIWQLGNHRLMCGDSTVREDVDRLIGGGKVDMVYTDPPYGISESGNRQSRKTNALAGHKVFKDFKDDSIEYAVKAYKICEDLNIPRQVWWGANYYCHSLPQSNNWFVWDKRLEEKQTDVNSDCELAWVRSKWSSIRIFRHLWKGLMKASEKGESRVHPTQKPIALAIWSFDYFKDVKTVLDLFLGSGSTLIACEKTGRKCYGLEIDPHYCSVIIERWEKFTGKKAVKE